MKTYFSVQRFNDTIDRTIIDVGDDAVLSEIQMDYNTVIMSPAFRRMQDKTQVFPLSRGDYVRTRLTHSFEVSIIAEQIAHYALIYLHKHSQHTSFQTWDDVDKRRFVDLAKTVGLIHDIGNPPFGHFGEDCIRNWFDENKRRVLTCNAEGVKTRLMDYINSSRAGYPLYEDFLNYDGNVQGLRVVLKAHPSMAGQGMNLVKSLVHAMVKYPFDSQTAVSRGMHKFGYNYAERDYFENVQKVTQTQNPRHLVTYILEAADDIAYRTADIEDALQKGVITIFDIKKYLKKHMNLEIKNDMVIYDSFLILFEESLADDNLGLENVRTWLQEVRVYLMKSVARQFAEHFEDIVMGRVEHYELSQACYARNFFIFAQDLTHEKIYDNKSVLDLEVGAKACMYDLLDLFVDAIIPYDCGDVGIKPTYYQKKIVKIIDRQYLDIYENEKRADDEAYNLYLRILCVLDYISSMTDRFAYDKRRTLMGTAVSD